MSIEIGVLIGFTSAIFGVAFGYANFRRNSDKDIQHDAVSSGELKSDIKYIRSGVDDMKVEMKVQGKQLDSLSERVTRVEESSKQAHKRLDEIRG